MPYTKRPAGGIKFERSTVTGATWAGPWELIPGATATITLPGGTPSKVDITTHEDVITYGGWRQNGAGLADTTDPSFTMLLDPDNSVHIAMLADVSTRQPRDYRITFPGGVVKMWGVRGQVGITAQGDINDYLRSTLTVLANVITFDVVASAAAIVATTTTGVLAGAETTVPVVSTTGFPASGVIILDGTDSVTYTGVTATSFTGCTGVLAHASGVGVTVGV